jgi:radical SAM protein with 4Fe4S-binding SPASM domain
VFYTEQQKLQKFELGWAEPHKDAIQEAVNKHASDTFYIHYMFETLEDMISCGMEDSHTKVPCSGLDFEFVIGADAKLYPCFEFWGNEEYSFGDLQKESFNKAWKSPRRADVKDKINDCYDTKNCNICNVMYYNKALYDILNNTLHARFYP